MAEPKGPRKPNANVLTEAGLAKHAGSIQRYLAGILRPDELEDATQTVLQRALENLEKFRGDSSPRVWLLGIARNVGLEIARARQREVSRTWKRSRNADSEETQQTQDLLAMDEPTQEDVLGRKEQQALVFEALHDMNIDDKLPLLITYVDGLPGPEAAKLLDLSFAAFRQRLSRARTALRKRLSELLERGEPGSAEMMAQWQAVLAPASRRQPSPPENPESKDLPETAEAD